MNRKLLPVIGEWSIINNTEMYMCGGLHMLVVNNPCCM